MKTDTFNSSPGPFAILRQFVRKPAKPIEKCELCATRLQPEHSHLLELESQKVVCACEPCSILFDGNTRQRFRRIPRDIRRLREFTMEDFEWESLLIPINLAYFVQVSSAGKTVARYPSPGGAMESSLDLDYWSAIVERNPVLNRFSPDVEALLVDRISGEPQYYRAPIDQCFRLVGLIRTHWRGFSGGAEVWREIDRYFEALKIASGEEHCA